MKSIDRDKLGEYLSAYLDGELTEKERKTLERLIARDEAIRRQYEELRQTAGLVRGLPRGLAPPALSEAITAAAERRQLLGEPEDVVVPRRPWWQSARSLLSAAAVLMITVAGAWYVFDTMDQPAGTRLAESRAPTEDKDFGREAMPGREPTRAEPAAEAKKAALGESHLAASPARGRAGEPVTEEVARDAADRGAALEKSGLRGVPSPTVAGELEEAPTLGVYDSRKRAARDEQARALALANFDQKLNIPVPASELVEHPFANEVNELVVFASDAGDEQLASQQLASFASSNSLVDLSTVDPNKPVPANERLIFAGRATYNYDEPDQQQFVVRMPRGELEGLVTALSRNPEGVRPLRLALGPLEVANADEAIGVSRKIGAPVGEPLPVAASGADVSESEEADVTPAEPTAVEVRGGSGGGHVANIQPVTRARRSAGLAKEEHAKADSPVAPGGRGKGPADEALLPKDQAPDDHGDFATETPRSSVERYGGAGSPSSQPAGLEKGAERAGDQVPKRTPASAPAAEPPPDEFVTLVVKVLRTDDGTQPATQPAEVRDK
jgi:hypothetical protein